MSRRQIVEASWIDEEDGSVLDPIPCASVAAAAAIPIPAEPPSSTIIDCSFGSDTCSTISNDSADSESTIDLESKEMTCQSQVSSSIPVRMLNNGGPTPTHFQLNLEDNLDSYISTMTDQTETNVYAFADSYDEITSVASTNFESTRLVV